MNDKPTVVFHRLVVRGKLHLPQALHIGSGESSRQSDAPIRRDKKGQPYIPGSTLGGLLRATSVDFAPYYFPDGQIAIDQLFGKAKNSESWASRLIVEDASLLTSLPDASEVRDYVGMDRRKGVARPHLQYDREVVPSNTAYHFQVSIDEPTQDEIRLLLAVLDFWSEFDFALHIGGRTTTGLGKARLEKGSLVFYRLDFSNRQILLDYLIPPEGTLASGVEYLPEAARVCREDIEPAIGQRYIPPQDTKLHAEAFRPQHLVLTIALVPEEPLLVQGAIPEIPEVGSSLYGRDRTSDADFVTALTATADNEDTLSARQYLPGSSLKGILRTRVEKIIRTLNFYRDNPDASDDTAYKNAEEVYKERICACAITHSDKDRSFPEELREPDKLLSCFGSQGKQQYAQKKARGLQDQNDSTFARQLYDKSCLTCRLFGNSMMRGRLYISDAELMSVPNPKLFDHVAINRFHGGAEDKRKFDTRPLMPQVADTLQTNNSSAFEPMFTFNIHLERPEPWMLGLLGHLLKDLKTADIRIGSATHRGYGKAGGYATGAELLVLPGSKLADLCKQKGLLPEEKTDYQQLGPGPYWRMALELPRLFGTAPWQTEGLMDEEILSTSTSQLLEECHKQFKCCVKEEEGKPHGDFQLETKGLPSLGGDRTV